MKKLVFIKKELIKLYGHKKTKSIITSAKRHYKECLNLCKDASSGEYIHLENVILTTVSFYKALLEIDNENAIENTRLIIMNLCQNFGKLLNKILLLPGMKKIFMKVLPKITLKKFGPECGFNYENFESSEEYLKIDMIKCPYLKYAKIFNVEEIAPIFCESDYATYGALKGIKFERTQTLASGENKCDFKFFRLNNENK